jgi:hypothetical protein
MIIPRNKRLYRELQFLGLRNATFLLAFVTSSKKIREGNQDNRPAAKAERG